MPLLCMTWSQAGSAGSVTQAAASYDHGVYELNLDVELHAQADRVFALISDMDGLHRLSSTILESSAMGPGPGGQQRRRLVMRTCLLFYCFKAIIVEDVVHIDKDTIIADVVPELSEFRSGHTEWRVTSAGASGTHIRLHSTFEPAFWVPPLIGPWIIKNRLVRAARETARRIEVLVADG